MRGSSFLPKPVWGGSGRQWGYGGWCRGELVEADRRASEVIGRGSVLLEMRPRTKHAFGHGKALRADKESDAAMAFARKRAGRWEPAAALGSTAYFAASVTRGDQLWDGCVVRSGVWTELAVFMGPAGALSLALLLRLLGRLAITGFDLPARDQPFAALPVQMVVGKGQMGSALMAPLQIIVLLTEGLFGVLPSPYFYLPKSARACVFPQSVKIHFFCSGPIRVDTICPLLRGRLPPGARRGGVRVGGPE